jgi:hypothetical protein
MWLPLNMDILCPSLLIILTALLIAEIVFFYKRNKAKLSAHDNAIKIQPSKFRFVFSLAAYMIYSVIPWAIILWVFPFREQFPYVVLVMFLSGMIPYYPYYTIVVYDGNLEGPTLWGWMWGREVIELCDLDGEKIKNRNYGKKLGILIFYAKDGKKILSLGLDNDQINHILDLASEAQALK